MHAFSLSNVASCVAPFIFVFVSFRVFRYPDHDKAEHNGPIIEEVDDDLPGESSSKRPRKGFGKIFKA